MGDHKAFFYGTLMEPQVLYRVCYGSPTPTSFQKSLLDIRPAILHKHCRHKVRGRDYPAITPSPPDSVRGTCVHGLTDGDFFRLDIFEGDEYERRKVKIRTLEVEGDEHGNGNIEGGEIVVDTYIWVAGEDELEEGEWDFGDFKREKMQRWIAHRDEYDDIEQAVEAHGGDPTGGRGANGNIMEQLRKEQHEKEIESAV